MTTSNPEITYPPEPIDRWRDELKIIESTVRSMMTNKHITAFKPESGMEEEERARMILAGVVKSLHGHRHDAADRLVLLAVRVGAMFSDGRLKK